jgi:hypothetical protein
MKKVLIITYYWPPAGGPGVQRWLKFAKYLPEFGWEPIILTVDENDASYPQEDSSLLGGVRGIETHKTKSFEILNLYSSLKKDKQIPYGGFSNEGNPSFLKKVSRFIRGNFFIPDPRKGWNKYAYEKAVELINNNNIDVVVTTSPPHSTQLIGLKLKKNGLAKKWIADLRDPWTDIFYYDKFYPTKWARRIDRKLEEEVIKNCDELITVSESIKNIYAERYDVADKTHVLTNGFDDDDFDDLTRVEYSNEIVYTGTVSDDYPLEQVIGMAKNTSVFNFKFIGKVPDNFRVKIKEENLENRFKFVSTIPHHEVVKEMASAGILLLLIPQIENNEGIVTGKVFEYLKSERPIYAIGPKNSDVESILNFTNSGGFVEYSDNSFAILKTYEDEFLKGDLKVESVNIERFSRKNITSKLCDILDKELIEE